MSDLHTGRCFFKTNKSGVIPDRYHTFNDIKYVYELIQLALLQLDLDRDNVINEICV